jgi:glycosyltransferase involved in cell wall biosynthesis
VSEALPRHFLREKATVAEQVKCNVHCVAKLDADFVVLTTGRIEERKGAENLIRLAQETSKVVANKRVHFLVVGATGNTGYTAELGDKFSAFNSRGLNCQINLLPAQTGNDLCDYYNAADAFAFSSISESFGLVVVEAAAHGLPVISWGEEDTLKTITGLPQMGYSIPCPNPQDIHERTIDGALFIKSLMDNPDQRNAIGQRAKALALANYNPEVIIQSLLSRIVK